MWPNILFYRMAQSNLTCILQRFQYLHDNSPLHRDVPLLLNRKQQLLTSIADYNRMCCTAIEVLEEFVREY